MCFSDSFEFLSPPLSLNELIELSPHPRVQASFPDSLCGILPLTFWMAFVYQQLRHNHDHFECYAMLARGESCSPSSLRR